MSKYFITSLLLVVLVGCKDDETNGGKGCETVDNVEYCEESTKYNHITFKCLNKSVTLSGEYSIELDTKCERDGTMYTSNILVVIEEGSSALGKENTRYCINRNDFEEVENLIIEILGDICNEDQAQWNGIDEEA